MAGKFPTPTKWKPKNIAKYKGDSTQIVSRSSWEKSFMIWCDTNPSVIQWQSEEVVIPYMSEVDGKPHRYFCDFVITIRNNLGKIKTYLIEIKPFYQTQPPVPKANKRTYMNECATYSVNCSKWEAATKYANDRGWEFKIITEHDLGK